MGVGKRFGFVFIGIVISLLSYLVVIQDRVSLPSHLLGHTAILVPDLLSKEVNSELLQLIKQIKSFPSNANDVQFYKTLREDIGEAQPLLPNGKCSHAYFVPSVNKTQCNLAGRADIGKHYIMTGGVEGKKENFEDSLSRLLSFGVYIFEPSKYPVVAQLFESPVFQESSRKICPQEKQILDPFQFNFIIQVPGQTVALHVDGVYFWGATRFEFPQWLLAAMKFSGLWESSYIDQIQVVAYVHEWSPSQERGGDFVYWNENKEIPTIQPAFSRFGSVIDGAKTVHAATVYYPHRKAPRLDKSSDNVLEFQKDDQWVLMDRTTNRVVANYSTNDLRISLVYRARCFESTEKREKFKNRSPEEILSLESILETFTNDLIRRGRLSKGVLFSQMDRLDLALLILDEYVRYPLPAKSSALIPYNYCAATKLLENYLPFLSGLLTSIHLCS